MTFTNTYFLGPFIQHCEGDVSQEEVTSNISKKIPQAVLSFFVITHGHKHAQVDTHKHAHRILEG